LIHRLVTVKEVADLGSGQADRIAPSNLRKQNSEKRREEA
jgi:hypothetical protein